MFQLNVNRTKAMWMNGKKDMNGIMMDGKVFEIINNIKYLGVYIDNKLNL